MYRCADAIKKLLLEAGVDRAFVIETEGNPVVYADRILNDNNLPTVLYSHKYLHIKEIYVNVSLFALQRSHIEYSGQKKPLGAERNVPVILERNVPVVMERNVPLFLNHFVL